MNRTLSRRLFGSRSVCAMLADTVLGEVVMNNRVCEMFGIEFPILAFTHCRDVVAAVTKAGGLGVLGAAGVSPEQLDIDLRWIRDEVGDRPFGVDVIVPAKYEGKEEGGLNWSQISSMIPQAHRDFLEDLLRRYEVPPLPDTDRRTGEGSKRAAPMTLQQASGLLDVAFSHPISLIANALGPPPPEMLEQARERGVKVRLLCGGKHGISDWDIYDTFSSLRLMTRFGVKVKRQKHLKLHAKLILVDGAYAQTGSMNIDRSAFDVRRELGIESDAPDVIGRLKAPFLADWEAAKKYEAPDPLDPTLHEEGELPPDPHFVHE